MSPVQVSRSYRSSPSSSSAAVVSSPMSRTTVKSGSTFTPNASNDAVTPHKPQPATPTVVPPTPSPLAGPSLASAAVSSAVPPASSPSSSSHDLFYDANDGGSIERTTYRRSMYRSPGTSSSPDLATLLRKARERGAPSRGFPSQSQGGKEKRREEPPPVPDFKRSQGRDGGLSSSSSRVNSSISGTLKAPKGSVRQKTSAFLGMILGQGTTRERSKTDASQHTSSLPHPHPSPVYTSFATPPVPPLPIEHQYHRSPMSSPLSEVFATPTRSPDSQKPLPPIQGSPAMMRDSEDAGEKSMVFVDKVSLPPSSLSLEPNPRKRESTDVGTITKRRSLSVGDADQAKQSSISSKQSSLRPQDADVQRSDNGPQWEDKSLSGILNDFKGELSQLDPAFVTSLDLRDPSTPARRAAARAKAENDASTPLSSTAASTPQKSTYDPSDRDTSEDLELPSGNNPLPPAIVPPRTSSLQSVQSLQSPTRSTSTPLVSPRGTNTRNVTSPMRPRNAPPQGPRESARLRVTHRSTASSSEPSLVPAPEDSRPVATRAGSQQDLTVNDLQRSRSPSNPSGTGDEPVDLEARGKELATRCWNEEEDFLSREKIAEWLGGNGRINKIALRHYIDFFDFMGLRLDVAFRRLCAKLYIKGETQQVDRILEEFSRRYWDCNPNGVYGNTNIVHAVSYSLLLLNTDLHVAELGSRMSRNQFVRNTLTAIQTQLQPSSPRQLSTSDLTYDDCSSSVRGTPFDDTETISRSKRSDSIASWNSVPRDAMALRASNSGSQNPGRLGTHYSNGSTPSVQISMASQDLKSSTSHNVYGQAWENEMETLLKEMYNAIKSQQILQPFNNYPRSSMSSLSPGGAVMMRNRSLRGQPDRLATLKRGSIRGLQSILTVQSGISPYSSNSSIDGRVSPSPSFATSTHEAMYGSSSSFLSPSLGFASNLSHTIIREAHEDDDKSVRSQGSTSTTISITDEELALLGAPWAKEGMLCRKQYWESTGKRAKDKTWMDVFVVIQKGELSMFVFGDNALQGSGTFGGGNWLANARSVGAVHLTHSLAHPLPPPGYNRQRPYCMVLTLANGGVYFFQAGTEELVNEWVSTCNYWAARTTKEPLAGGVSNMEYGWNRAISQSQNNDPTKEVDYSDGISVRSSKSARLKIGWRDGMTTVRGGNSPWIDKTYISDWRPPMPPSVASTHDEEAQLEALRKHVASMKKDLESHNELREPMLAMYQPRSANAIKAQSNWEKKSQYLLTEIVKYDSYIESLQAAMSLRLKKRGDKALERALNSPVDDLQVAGKGKWKGPEEATIREETEPITPRC